MNLILGASGRVGRALRSMYGEQEVIAPGRAVYQDWWRPNSVTTITRYLEAQARRIDTIFVAAGIIDPAASAVDHERINAQLPQQVIRAAAPLGIRVVTFGTVMETVLRSIPSAGYVASKAALGAFVERHAQAGTRVMHLRIHTLYGGGPPAAFMFAGQMLTALQTRTPFLMSPGTQLREYHHIDDEKPAIAEFVASNAVGIVELNHGDAVSLAEIAQSTFAIFGATDLLRIGALPLPTNEKPGVRFARSPLLASHDFRDVRVAMADYLAAQLSGPKAVA
jgi:nucleoside-diphosphate-sugar epimerase